MQALVPAMNRIARLVTSRAAWRAVFALTISAALMLSLMQMPCCDSVLAEGPVTVTDIAADLGHQKSSHVPAGHCDHCLVHVAFEPFVSPAEGRVEFASAAPTLPNDAAPASVAGLPLFKPPRA
jgi:hypothetical protein